MAKAPIIQWMHCPQVCSLYTDKKADLLWIPVSFPIDIKMENLSKPSYDLTNVTELRAVVNKLFIVQSTTLPPDFCIQLCFDVP